MHASEPANPPNPPKLHRFLGGLRGHLSKQGKVFKQWRTRYFVLDQQILQCYMDDTQQTIHGEVLISDATQVYDVTEDVEGMKHLFYVIGRNASGTEEVMFLSAASDKEKQDWIEAIIDQVHFGFKQIAQSDLWPAAFFPAVDLVVTYQGVQVENGNILRPVTLAKVPEVVLKGVQAEDRHCLLLLDMDSIPLTAEGVERTYLHWAVINFIGGDIASGDEVAPYQCPAPLFDSGLHRFFFLLFRLTQPLTPVLLNETMELYLRREGFPLAKWAKTMGFEQPAGINGMYAGWEEHCDEVHRTAHLMPPEPYRSPAQVAYLLLEAQQADLERQKVELHRDLGLQEVLGEADEVSRPGLISYQMAVSFGQEAARDGGILAAQAVRSAPAVSYKAYTEAVTGMHTLLLVDPDEPCRTQPTDREHILWAVTNIPGTEVSQGEVLLSYEPPAPAFNSGLHRCIFMLYKQTHAFTTEEVHAAREQLSVRTGLRSCAWVRAQGNKLQAIPVGLEAFLVEWDDSVDALHLLRGVVPPKDFCSPSQLATLKAQRTAEVAAITAEEVLAAVVDEEVHGSSAEVVWARREALETEAARKVAAAEASFLHSVEHPEEHLLVLQPAATTEEVQVITNTSEEEVTSSTTEDVQVSSAPLSAQNKVVKGVKGVPKAVEPAATSSEAPSAEGIMLLLAQSSLMPQPTPEEVPMVVAAVHEEVQVEHEVETVRTVSATEEVHSSVAQVSVEAEEMSAFTGAISDSEMAQLIRDEDSRLAARADGVTALSLAQAQAQILPPQIVNAQPLPVPAAAVALTLAAPAAKALPAAAPIPVIAVASAVPAPTSAPAAVVPEPSTINSSAIPVPAPVPAPVPRDVSPARSGGVLRASSMSNKDKDQATAAGAGTPPAAAVAKKSVKIAEPSLPPATPLVSPGTPLAVSSPEDPIFVRVPSPAHSDDEGSPKPAPKKKPSLQRNPSVAAMGAKKASPMPPARVNNKDMYSAGMDGLDELLSVGFSNAEEMAHLDDDDDSVVPPPSSGSSARSPTTPVAPVPASPVSDRPELAKKTSLFRPRSQLMSPADAAASSPVGPTASLASPLRRMLTSSQSMYIKPAAAAENIRATLTSASSAVDQCKAFKIETASVFEGGTLSHSVCYLTLIPAAEVMKKKYSSDFMFKDSFVWISPTTKSLHWYLPPAPTCRD